MKEISIVECGEKMVDVLLLSPRIVFNPRLKSTGKQAFLRHGVAQKLLRVLENLPSEISIVINDAWRPPSVQRQYIKKLTERLERLHPEWSSSKISIEVNKYVAPAEGPNASGHLCGASVDIRLVKNGRLLPMRSNKLSYQENAVSVQPKLPKQCQKNRLIMFEACEKAGLVNYPEEYWHWCYGDYLWAEISGNTKAIYGVISKP